MKPRHHRPHRTGTPWQPAPEVPGYVHAERLRQEMEAQWWTTRNFR